MHFYREGSVHCSRQKSKAGGAGRAVRRNAPEVCGSTDLIVSYSFNLEHFSVRLLLSRARSDTVQAAEKCSNSCGEKPCLSRHTSMQRAMPFIAYGRECGAS